MQRWNRLPHALDQSVVIRKRAVLLGIRCGRQDNISRRRCFILEQLLDHQEIEFRKRVRTTLQLFRQKAAHHVERANCAARIVENLRGRRGASIILMSCAPMLLL